MLSRVFLVYLMHFWRLQIVFRGLVVLANLVIEDTALGSRTTALSPALLVVLWLLVLLQSSDRHKCGGIFSSLLLQLFNVP